MPPSCQIVPIVLTFDALETLIQVTGGAGYQYWCAARQFLSASPPPSQGDGHTSATPSRQNETLTAVSEPSQAALNAFNVAAIGIIRDSMKVARGEWAVTHPGEDPKTMPIGGNNARELTAFWHTVLRRVFTELALPGLTTEEQAYLGTLATRAATVTPSDARSASDDAFARLLQTIVFDRFGSTEAHSWLPAGQRTLQQLREWNVHQWQRAHAMATQDAAHVALWTPAFHDASATPVLVLARPPAIVSNMDPRLRSVMKQLGAFAGDAPAPISAAAASSSSPSTTTSAAWEAYVQQPALVREWPLISEVITGRDAGRAKPSAMGLALAATHAGLDRNTLPAPLRTCLHIHVGDAEADQLACQAQECRYLPCEGHVGVVWESLLDVLKESEANVAHYVRGENKHAGQ